MILKLLSGLELSLSEDGKAARTVPERSEVEDVLETVVEVEAWLRAHWADSVGVVYCDVRHWLDLFEDQYSYLSSSMPVRQRGAINHLKFQETLANIKAKNLARMEAAQKLKKKSN